MIEEFHAALTRRDERNFLPNDPERTAARFTEEINACLIDEGIGWQLVDGRLLHAGRKLLRGSFLSRAISSPGRSGRRQRATFMRPWWRSRADQMLICRARYTTESAHSNALRVMLPAIRKAC